MFDRDLGLNIAEFEFPAYFNKFVLGRPIVIITTSRLRKKIEAAFQETLWGPKRSNYEHGKDYPSGTKESEYPNFWAESLLLDPHRASMHLKDLVEFQVCEPRVPRNLRARERVPTITNGISPLLITSTRLHIARY